VRVIQYELNEVPWRVVDWYVSMRPNSSLAKLLSNASCFTTVSRDEGELHPWSTWPSLHRGVYNTTHKIRFINQDLTDAKMYPPIWETLASSGVSVGVFGSLQSYPVPSPLNRNYRFYVPDTFARSGETYPDAVSAFQRINLRQTRRDGAQASALNVDWQLVSDSARVAGLGLTLGTGIGIGVHLLRERINPGYKARRAFLQAPIAFDIFLRLLRRTRPEYSTFFTNHVAGAMHRYWKYTFPEDFPASRHESDGSLKKDHIRVAMDIVDRQVGVLLRECGRLNADLVVVSSMGQEAVLRDEYIGELRMMRPEEFLNRLGFAGRVANVLAMQPDFNFVAMRNEDASELVSAAATLCGSDGTPLFGRIQRNGLTVNLGMAAVRSVISTGLVMRRQADGGLSEFGPASKFGIDVILRDPGTGYHQPKGILIWRGSGVPLTMEREEIELSSVRGMLLSAFGLSGHPAKIVAMSSSISSA
jgi:hypothetical protein